MGAPYSQDLRVRVLRACDRGMKTGQVAELFDVCKSWVRRLKQRRRETGRTTPRPTGGATLIKIDPQKLTELVRRNPDATVKELHAMLGTDCSESGVDAALRRLGLSLKKSRSGRRSRTARTSPSVASPGRTTSPRSTPGS